ncbi:hypothetical protein CU097_001736 [Rhizopus azygosporus]|uniref:tRNA-splicing endonuclease subunit Sen15 domain-containing protein n=2 Tax=Rhizopus TaxID=4842 RepID=A0A367IQA3_RHIAZ|nr:hypothetical protein CU097_001736 [Rhizopus azygosporus]
MSFESKIKDIQSKPMSPMDAYLSQQVYSDLVLTKKWKHVDYQFINQLQTCIFMTKEPGIEELLYILPFSETESLSLKKIATLFDAIKSEMTIDIK